MEDEKSFLSQYLAKEFIVNCTDKVLSRNGEMCNDFFYLTSHFRGKPLGELETLATYCRDVHLRKGMSLTQLYHESKRHKIEKLWERDRTVTVPNEPWFDRVMSL